MVRSGVVRVLLGAFLLAVTAAPAAAQDTVQVDFETGPALETPITTEYQASAFVFFQQADKARPYRRSAPGKARSGSVVANIGADRCVPEGGTGSDCEFAVGGTVGRLTRTASSVKLYAGLFQAANGAVTVQLRAFRANGTVAATGPAVTVNVTGFTTEVSVTSAAPDIARFQVLIGGAGAIGAAVGFDDLTLVYPTGSLPEVALSAPPDTVAVQQGGSVDVPVTVTRLNGSNGALDLAVSGLPPGVTGEFLPDPVPGTTSAATLRLSATPDAPRSPQDVPQAVTVTGDPQGNASVAPGSRTVTVPVRVASRFELRAAGATTPAVATCASTDVPLRLERDRAFTGTVRLDVVGLPAGVTASLTPGPEIAPGGGFFVGVTLRLTGPVAPIADTRISVDASSAGAPSRRLALDLKRAVPTATVQAPSTLKLRAPQKLRPGSDARLEGNGFCPGTLVRVGNSAGEAPVTIEDGGRALRFTTPRLATSGPVTVVPPQGSTYPATNGVTVDTYRSTNGLSFGNFPFTGLSLSEAAEVFGYDELFFKVNPCWPWSNCSIITPVPDPTALVAYGIIDDQMQTTGGHCFGISRAVQGWTSNPATLNQFTSGPNVFSIPGRSGALDSFLDGQHALQASAEFIETYFRRPQTINGNLEVIRSQLASGETPLVSLRFGDAGHAVLAYDLVDRPDGGVDVLLYDNNVPFQADELTNGTTHRQREATRSVIRISPDRKRWEFDNGALWSGGGDTLFASKRNAIPLDPSLPGLPQLLEGLKYLVFGSADGAVRTDARPQGADYLPLLDESAQDGAGGAVGVSNGRLSHTVRGIKVGRYSQAVFGDGLVAGVEAPTAVGVRDTTSAVPGGDGVAFAALGDAPARTLRLDVAAKQGKASSRRASLVTRTFGGGQDIARLDDGTTLRYTHDGAATTMSFTLQSVQTNGGPAAFTSGPLRVGKGETVSAKPTSWRSLDRVRVTMRAKSGKTRSKVLRSRAKAPASLAITALRVSGRRVSVTTRFGRLPQFAGAGVVLRAVRGGKTAARKAFKIEQPKAGSQTLQWTLPRTLPRGTYRLVANAALAVGGKRTGTVRRQRSVSLRVR